MSALCIRMTNKVVWQMLLGLCLLCGSAWAAEDFLPPEKAFMFSAKMLDSQHVEVRYHIADGYYLYREKLAFVVTPVEAQLGRPELPPGEIKFDENFQKDVEHYRGDLVIRLPILQSRPGMVLTVTSQGCADQGLCYPPRHDVFVMQNATESEPITRVGLRGLWQARGDVEQLGALLQQIHPAWLIFGFLLLGLSLSFTPCVLPMVPILSSIIVGQAAEAVGHRGKGMWLSLTYVLGMALVYTLAGILTALAGASMTSALQTPWALGVFAALLVGMALSMFGYYELQLPSRWRDQLAQLSGRQQGGQYVGVFVMGALSAVIVGPCMTAPLAGILTLIAQSGSPVLGGALLFSMALGMGVPLLLIGAGAGSLLPRAGAWMESVKRVFGVLLLALALWMLTPILPAWLEMLTWAVLLLGCASFLHAFDSLPVTAGAGARLWKGLGVLLALGGGLLILGVASGGRDLLQPLAHWGRANNAVGGQAASTTSVAAPLVFERVSSVAELESRLQKAGRPVMLDFYADWCVSCKEMERFTFTDAAVKRKLQGVLLLQADVTANREEDQALLQRFGLFGPPGIIFFDAEGQEIRGHRVIGFQAAGRFLQSVQAALAE